MNIKGFIKTSLLDYPGTIAATVFTGGCNFSCPFCHNGDLVLDYKQLPSLSTNDIIQHLKNRKGLIDGLCITGGEPTLQKDLIAFMDNIKNLGVKIKLDTNGYKPNILESILKSGLVDYVAMDIKNSPSKYATTCGLNFIDLNKINKSINLLISSSVQYEFRTTVVKEFHTNEDILNIVDYIKGANKYCLQQFVPSEKQITLNLHSYSNDTLIKLGKMIEPYFEKVEIRGV